MGELIFDYLNSTYYLNIDNNSAYIKYGDVQIGFSQIESLICTIFNLTNDYGQTVIFNWLLINGIKIVNQKWNTTYMVHNDGYTVSTTEDISFDYKLITND